MKIFLLANSTPFDASVIDTINSYLSGGGVIDQIVVTPHGTLVTAYRAEEVKLYMGLYELSSDKPELL